MQNLFGQPVHHFERNLLTNFKSKIRWPSYSKCDFKYVGGSWSPFIQNHYFWMNHCKRFLWCSIKHCLFECMWMKSIAPSGGPSWSLRHQLCSLTAPRWVMFDVGAKLYCQTRATFFASPLFWPQQLLPFKLTSMYAMTHKLPTGRGLSKAEISRFRHG